MKNQLRTKIIATIGPASGTEDKIEALIKAGARAFRINTSHGNQQEHLEILDKIRSIALQMNIYIPVILDLQGPKIRVGNLKEPIELIEDEIVVIKPCMDTDEERVIPVDYCNIDKDLKEGDSILMDDGKIGLKTLKVNSGEISALVTNGGVLTSRKGVNVPATAINMPSITPRDVEFIKFAVENNLDFIALSFVRKKEDILNAKNHLKQMGSDIPVIAKIEKPEAVDNLTEIISASDGILIARGDLGIEISLERVPVVQKHIIKEVNSAGKEVITATQMLESMIKEPLPTRAEASDVANAIIDGTDALLLTGETAVGQFPVKVVQTMKLIAENVENSDLYRYNTFENKINGSHITDSQSIANAAIKILEEVEIKAIVAFTRSGFTGRLFSKAKPGVPVIAISDNREICKKLNLLWGVFPYFMEFSPSLTEEYLRRIDNFLITNTFLEKEDKIVITGSMPCLTTGTTNFIRIHELGSF